MSNKREKMRKSVKTFLANNRWLKKVPTTLTICNSLCGYVAILYTLHVYSEDVSNPARVLEISAWVILFAMVFDALDGFTARIFNAASLHGLQMDSLSDMVTFGLAPMVIVAIMAHKFRELKTSDFYIVWGLCSVYIGCAANRLANYNIHAMLQKRKAEKFRGLPSPGAAAGICSLVIYYSISTKELKQIVNILPVYAGILGFLMISEIRYVHVGKWLQTARRSKIKLLVLASIILCLIFKPAITIVIAINIYILSGPFNEFILRKKEENTENEPENEIDTEIKQISGVEKI